MQFGIQRRIGPIFFCATFVALTSTAAKAASNAVILPGTQYEVRVGKDAFRSFTTPRGEALLSAIVTWLSTNLDLPAIYDHPHIEFVPQQKMATVRYRGLMSDRVSPLASNADALLDGEQS